MKRVKIGSLNTFRLFCINDATRFGCPQKVETSDDKAIGEQDDPPYYDFRCFASIE